MQAFFAFTSILLVPIGIVNVLSGVVAGIWLAILGEWWAILYGLLAFAVGVILLSLVLLPSTVFVARATYFLEKGQKILAYPFVFLSALYTVAVITAWCTFVLGFFIANSSASSFYPLLLWSYGVGVTPWAYMAHEETQEDPSNYPPIISTFFTQVGYIIMMIAVIFFPVTFLDTAMIFGVVMVVNLGVQFRFAIEQEKEKAKYGLT